jgi:mRNA interferase RelE/StbE
LAWAIEFTPEAVKALARLGNEAERRVVKFLRERVSRLDDPRSVGEPLKGARFAGLWRYRAGDYRILCDIQDERVTVLVVLVGHRREVYR